MTPIGILALSACGVAALLGFNAIFTIDQKEAGIVTRFGKFLSVAHAGLNFKIPFIDRVAGIMDLRVIQMVVEVQTKTKDNVFVTIVLAIQYYTPQDKVETAFYALADHEAQIEAYVSDTVRAQVPTMPLDDVFEHKDGIAGAVREQLTETMSQYGFVIAGCLVTEIDPDEKVVEAMNEINAAQRHQTAATALAEAERTMMVTKARATAEAMKLEGQGIADQRKAILEGLGETVAELKAKIPGIDDDKIMAVVMLTRYFDTLKEVAGSSETNLIMLPNSPGGFGDLQQQIFAALRAGGGGTTRATVPTE